MNRREDGRHRRVRLRTAVFRIGRLLGWSARDVIAFTEAVANRPFRRCGCDDFERVLEEYWAIGRVIEETRERREQDLIEGENHVAAKN